MMPTDTFKKVYVQSQVNGNVLAQLKLCFWEDTTQLFTIVNETFKTLISAFKDSN